MSYGHTKHILVDVGNRKGDIAIIAEIDGIKAGAAFIRYWNDDINIRGYISEDIPVLIIGVVEGYRRQGIGDFLIDSLKTVAKENDISKISLCVTKSNVVYHLYTKQNFKIVQDINSSYNMLWEA